MSAQDEYGKMAQVQILETQGQMAEEADVDGVVLDSILEIYIDI
jgi:hypothetical protein